MRDKPRWLGPNGKPIISEQTWNMMFTGMRRGGYVRITSANHTILMDFFCSDPSKVVHLQVWETTPYADGVPGTYDWIPVDEEVEYDDLPDKVLRWISSLPEDGDIEIVE